MMINYDEDAYGIDIGFHLGVILDSYDILNVSYGIHMGFIQNVYSCVFGMHIGLCVDAYRIDMG